MRQIPLDNDWEPEYAVTQKNSSTGQDEPATGLVGLKARLSATDGGAAIDPTLETNVGERLSVPGTYFGFVEGDALRARALAFVGVPCYAVFGDGINILFSELVEIVPVRHV
jgi:hypothetical protein